MSGVLLGGPFGTTEDSVTFRLERRARQTLAVWLDAPVTATGVTVSSPVRVLARCGAAPTHTSYARAAWASSVYSPAFLELTAPCADGWFVTVVSISTAPAAFHVRVGVHRAGREWSSIRVGIESATSGPAEEAFIRAVVREAAWRVYGATGGSQLVRSFEYVGSCDNTNVHICFRNRPRGGTGGCAEGTGYFVAGGSLGSVHLCTDPTPSLSLRGPAYAVAVSRAANLLAHEFGHLFTGTGLVDSWLQDEYFRSESPFNEICGFSRVFLNRCTHSLMAGSWSPRVVSLCVPRTHNAAVEVFFQAPPFTMPRTLAIARGGDTITECSDGRVNTVGPAHSSAWDQLRASGAIEAPHPNWTPDNFSFVPFAGSRSIDSIGRNLN